MNHALRFRSYGNGVLFLLFCFLTGCSAGIFYAVMQKRELRGENT